MESPNFQLTRNFRKGGIAFFENEEHEPSGPGLLDMTMLLGGAESENI